jgi:DNA-binding CsgD family transcriptional regulator
MTTAVADTTVSGAPLGPDSRPVAALSVTVDELPDDLVWEEDEASATRFALVSADGREFALESEDGAPEPQITVYGGADGEGLDALLAALGIDEDRVLDRIDHRQAKDEEALPELSALVREQVSQLRASLEGRLIELETRANRLEEERKRAAAVLIGVGEEELTERQRQTLVLLVSGMSADEVAEVLKISRASVLKHRRQALSHRPRRPDRGDLTARETQVARLAAKGMSNREIAEALFVTVKTVEWHLKHAYEKLGVRSREELRLRLSNG